MADVIDVESVRQILADARRAGRRWDLVVVDPPTFSNSKRMDYTWDFQRDHLALLADVLAVCTGTVWFSTNRRRFQLELADPSVAVTDMTHATIPSDFRDARIHTPTASRGGDDPATARYCSRYLPDRGHTR